MKTTLDLDDELLRRAKRRAAERGTTLTRVVEDGLRAALAERVGTEPFRLRIPTVRGIRAPAVDVADREALFDVLEDG